MSKFHFTLFLTAVVALLLGWLVTVWATPRIILKVAHDRIVETVGSPNQMFHGVPVTPQNQTIVRQAPDLLYSACAYDLKDGPVTIEVGPTLGYWSASFFDAATNNYQTLSRIGNGQDAITFQLIRSTDTDSLDETLILSPSMTGVALIRRRLINDVQTLDMRAAQAGDTCIPADK